MDESVLWNTTPWAIKWIDSSAHSIDPNLAILQQTDAFEKWGGTAEFFRFLCLVGDPNSLLRAILASKQSFEMQADLFVQSSWMLVWTPPLTTELFALDS